MKKFKTYLLAAAGFLVLVFTISLTPLRTSIAQGVRECVRICNDEPLRVVIHNVARIVGDVKITNGSDEPVPTKNIGPDALGTCLRRSGMAEDIRSNPMGLDDLVSFRARRSWRAVAVAQFPAAA